VLFFKCINVSDVNIESQIFEILGIRLSADIIFTVYSLCKGRKERDGVVFKYILKHFRYEYKHFRHEYCH
jgi:hypothetical protein